MTEVTVDASYNPLGLVRSSRKCSTCERLIWWNHYPGRPEEFEPAHERCSFCEPW